jgi:hypothetical protein
MCVCVCVCVGEGWRERNWAWAYLKMRPLPIVSWLLDLLGRAPHQNRVGGSGCHRLSSLRVDRFISEKLLVSRPHQRIHPFSCFFFWIFKIPAEITPSQKIGPQSRRRPGIRPFRYRYSYTFLFTFGHANPERLWPGLPWLFARIISIVTCSASFINSK